MLPGAAEAEPIRCTNAQSTLPDPLNKDCGAESSSQDKPIPVPVTPSHKPSPREVDLCFLRPPILRSTNVQRGLASQAARHADAGSLWQLRAQHSKRKWGTASQHLGACEVQSAVHRELGTLSCCSCSVHLASTLVSSRIEAPLCKWVFQDFEIW